jgi:spore coat polysaccharide biosynthesis predicted glycosyltransferase SpsG
MSDHKPALLVCQAGEGIGLGHLTRCMVVAHALRDKLGADVHLLIQGSHIERADLLNFQHQFIPASEPLVDFLTSTIPSGEPWLLALDIHPAKVPDDLDSLLLLARNTGCRTIGIDGLLKYRNQLDMVFLPSMRCDDPLAQGPGTPVVYGLDCILIPEITSTRTWAPGPDVLVLTGGSDATRLGKIWPTQLDAALSEHTRVQWVRGPYAQAPQQPTSPRLSWLIHQAPASLQSHMTGVNYALTVFGVSFFELIKMGVPTVVFSPYGNKDLPDLRLIDSAGLGLTATDERDAIAKLMQLMADDELAHAISNRCQRAMAHSGAERLIQLVAPWRPKSGTCCTPP